MLGFVCLLITMVILIAGLWPFQFNPVNKVKIPDGGGLLFYGQGIVFSPGSLIMQDTTSQHSAFTIELFLCPRRETNNFVGSIFSIYGGNRDQVIFGQWKKELIIRIPAAKVDNHRHYREISVENALARDSTHLITATSSRETTAVYIDGHLEKIFRLFSLIPEDRQLAGHLVLGNSPEGTNPWNGTFLGMAIYDYILTSKEIHEHLHAWQKQGQPLVSDERASLQADKSASLRAAKPTAMYLFDGHDREKIRDEISHNDLLIPTTFKPLRRSILGMPEKDQWLSCSNLKDVAINIVGFTPLGLFLSAWLRQFKNLTTIRVHGFSILMGFSLSLAIELIQAYIPTRDSSLLDVISNTAGTAAGSLLIKYLHPVLHAVKDDTIALL
ncbi:MAG TPA: VanZ family protein [Nitrospirota bacterium]|nr:VanZ family protein [Nitrospirota bacterium]